MNTGMLWFDNNPKTALAEKVIRAVQYYTEKYGRVPNLCLVNPSALDDPGDAKDGSERKSADIGTISVRPYRPVLPGHLWIGIEESN